MAIAKRVKPDPTPDTIQLTLTLEEAMILERFLYTGRWVAQDEGQPSNAATIMNGVWAPLRKALRSGSLV